MHREPSPRQPQLTSRPGFAALAAVATCLVAGLLLAQDGRSLPRLTYTKVLNQSVPEYLAISVDANGFGTYEGRKLDDVPAPRPLRVSPATTRRLFDLAAELNDFDSLELESHRKVANLGLKTLTYERDGRRNKVEFNYTLVREADRLVTLFEKIAGVEQHVTVLEYAIKYDHLSLPRELLQIQVDLDNKSLAEAELMVPTLEQIARDPHFLHLAQARAQNILQRLQNSSN